MQTQPRANIPQQPVHPEPGIFRLLRELGESTLFSPYSPYRH